MSRVVIVSSLVRDHDERQRFAEFLIQRTALTCLAYVGHPLPKSRRQESLFTLWCKGKAVQSTTMQRNHHSQLSWGIDLLLTFFLILRTRMRFDYYVGVNSWFQVLPGLVLREFGLVGRFVFWATDFETSRFQSRFLNSIYLSLDRVCFEHADFCWVPSSRVLEARASLGYMLDSRRIMKVPYGISKTIPRLIDYNCVEPDSIMYMGSFEGRHGLELLMQIMPKLISVRPNIRVTISSYENIPAALSSEIRKRGLTKYFLNLGFIESEDALNKEVSRKRVGLALYDRKSGSYKDPARPKHFLAMGVPIIITRFASLASEVKEHDAGLVINYEADDLYDAITKILTDDDLFIRQRRNALELARNYTADRFYGRLAKWLGLAPASHVVSPDTSVLGHAQMRGD